MKTIKLIWNGVDTYLTLEDAINNRDLEIIDGVLYNQQQCYDAFEAIKISEEEAIYEDGEIKDGIYAVETRAGFDFYKAARND